MAKLPYTPPKLPPDIDITPVIKLLTDARDAIARFDEAVKRLPNPAIIRRAFETQEAVLSSRIEGTQATLEEVLEFDAEDGDREENEKQRDYREIINYRAAIDSGKKMVRDRPIDENAIKELHKGLLNSVRGRNKSPGEFRRHQVHIGPAGATAEEATYVPPEHTKIPELISNLVNYLHNDDQPDRLIQAAIMHYQFEAIHPFADGNGRVGRLLIPLYLYEKGVTEYPNLYISEFLEAHRRDYYEKLNRVSEYDEWIEWITFFLRAVREQAKLAKDRVERIEKLYKELHNRLPEFNSIYASNFLEALFSQPTFTPQSIGKVAAINNTQTLYNLIAKFAKAGLITDLTTDKARNKLYMFEPLVVIL
jgi:cell filamentation protein, protein adenylyltransferase